MANWILYKKLFSLSIFPSLHFFHHFQPQSQNRYSTQKSAFENYPQVLPVAAGSTGNPLKILKILPLTIFTSHLFEENLPELWWWEEKKPTYI